MKEQDVKNLASQIYRLADFLQEIKSDKLKKDFPILKEKGEQVFLKECERIEEWLEEIKQ